MIYFTAAVASVGLVAKILRRREEKRIEELTYIRLAQEDNGGFDWDLWVEDGFWDPNPKSQST